MGSTNAKSKKLLILGGKPIGSCELVRAAQKKGIYTIVADYLETEQSAAKRIADEAWLVSTADLDKLEKMAKEAEIDGVLSGVHEFNIEKMIALCERLNLPCYTNLSQWEYCKDKSKFKQLCREHGVPVSPEYDISEADNDAIYPVIVKPVDSSGSRGFSVCNNKEDLLKGYENALSFSESKKVLIEKYMPNDAVIIHYTLIDGQIYFSGMSEKKSMKLKEYGSFVMALQVLPSPDISRYLKDLDNKVRKMFKDAGMKNGIIWIEAFKNGDEFVFNEMGYRFGGSLTYYPVKYFYNIDQLDIMLEYAIHGNYNNIKDRIKFENVEKTDKKNYCILPLHLNEGVIKEIVGEKEILDLPGVYAYVPVHHVGDSIKKWGTAQQVFCYLHIVFSTKDELKKTVYDVLDKLCVYDTENKNLLFLLFDIDSF